MRTLIAFPCALLVASLLTVPPVGVGAAADQQPGATPPPGPRLAGAPDETFVKDGVTLRYRELGSGEPVVLIHGYTATLESMAGLANVLADDHRVIALDVRGFGRSSKFAEASQFGPRMVDDVAALMDHLKVPRAHIVGHSMGALIGANVVAKYPKRVISATLIAGPFYADAATFRKEAAPWISDMESGKGLGNFIQWLFPKMDAKMVAMISGQIMKSNDLPSLIAVMRSLPEIAIAGVKGGGVNTLVAVGTVDPLQPFSQSFVRSSAGAKLLQIEGADHLTIATHPDVVRAMRELTQSTSSRAQPLRDAA
jgi:pimeloyl-ACP methyl ester carboxylesterase